MHERSAAARTHRVGSSVVRRLTHGDRSYPLTFPLDATADFPRSSRMRLRRLSSVLIAILASAVLGAAASPQGGPIPLAQGVQVGRTMFEPGDTARGGNGQPVDGIEGSSSEMLKVHVHA